MPLEVYDVAAQAGHCAADTVNRDAKEPPAVQLMECLRELFARQASVVQ
jgi:hypothetical protein